MSILSNFVSGGIGEILGGIGQLAKDIRVAITGKDPVKMAEIEAKLLELESAASKAQTDTNMEEARHPSIFVAGWRPFIGWVCGFGLAWQFLGHPLFVWIVTIAKLDIQPPVLETEGLIGLIMALRLNVILICL